SARFASIDAAVGERKEYVPLVIDTRVDEVQQIATRIAAASVPNASFALNWSGRSRVNGRPGFSAIVSVRDVAVPCTFEACELMVAASAGANKCHSCAIRVAGNDCGKHRVLNSHAQADVYRFVPGDAAVATDRQIDVIVLVFTLRRRAGLFSDVSEINCIRGSTRFGRTLADTKGRIKDPRNGRKTVGYLTNRPSCPTIR